jgi:hypothetical protein
VSRAAAARFLVTTFNSGFGHLFVYFYFAGIPIAAVLMGIALWRSRSVPRWWEFCGGRTACWWLA